MARYRNHTAYPYAKQPFRDRVPCQKEYESDIHWFTLVTEVNLCGHVTQTTAHVLFNH